MYLKQLYLTLSAVTLTTAGLFAAMTIAQNGSPSVVYVVTQGRYVTALHGILWSIFTASSATGQIADINNRTLFWYSSSLGYQTLYLTP